MLGRARTKGRITCQTRKNCQTRRNPGSRRACRAASPTAAPPSSPRPAHARVIREVYELYGFEAVETPFIEYTDALGKFLPDQDRPNEGVFSFQDDDEQWLSLRYDLTAPLARYVAREFRQAAEALSARYRVGLCVPQREAGPRPLPPVHAVRRRHGRRGLVAADAEICMMAADTLERLGIKRGDYVIKVNNRKVLDGVMEAIGLDGDENAGRRLIVLRAIDKLDRLGPRRRRTAARRRPQGRERRFHQGRRARRPPRSTARSRLHARRARQTQRRDHRPARACGGRVGARRSKASRNCTTSRPRARRPAIGADRVLIDPSVVRGLEYYTGPVFEAELTFEVTDEKGHPVRFGSVGGGGRYDGLVGRFRGEPVPATGFSIGVSRLFAALKLIDSPIVGAGAQLGPVVVLVMDRDRIARLPAHGRALCAPASARRTLSRLGRHEGADEICRQAQRALRRHPGLGRARPRRGADQGSDRGVSRSAAIDSNEEWKAARPAQFSVPESGAGGSTSRHCWEASAKRPDAPIVCAPSPGWEKESRSRHAVVRSTSCANPLADFVVLLEVAADEDDAADALFVRLPFALQIAVEDHVHALEDEALRLVLEGEDALASAGCSGPSRWMRSLIHGMNLFGIDIAVDGQRHRLHLSS